MTGTAEVPACVWPASALAEAVDGLARLAGFEPGPVDPLAVRVPPAMDGGTFAAWVERVARLGGVEAEPVEAVRSELARTIRSMGPSLIRLPFRDGEPRFLAILGCRFGRLLALGTDGSLTRLKPAVVCRAVGGPADRSRSRRADRLLDAVGVPAGRRDGAREALLAATDRGEPMDVGWILRIPAGRDLRLQGRRGGIGRILGGLVATHVAQVALILMGWGVIAGQALEGRLDTGTLAGWALLLAGQVPLGLARTALQGRLATRVSGLVHRRLLAGILRLRPDEIRVRGSGELLGRALGAQALEDALLGAGIPGILGVAEWMAAAVLLGIGAGAYATLVLLAWTALLAIASVRYVRCVNAWREAELARTAGEAESIASRRGDRAPAAPDLPGADASLDRSLRRLSDRDRIGTILHGLGSGGWLFVGVVALWPVLVAGTGSPGPLALAIAGVLLAGLAFQGIVAGLPSLAEAWGSWCALRDLAGAGSRSEPAGSPAFAGSLSSMPLLESRPVVDVRDASFRYPDRGNPVLDRAGFEIHAGDRILVGGPSGAGKSTFAALLAGLRRPDAGLIRVRGLDLDTIGAEAWRHRVVIASQEPDNRIFPGSLALNLLFGLGWPPGPDALAAAERICEDLGLGDLVRRMPAGIHQPLGEDGWRLSAGEECRVLLGRALLRKADLVILDGTFDGLDARTAELAVKAALDRAKTLIVIGTG